MQNCVSCFSEIVLAVFQKYLFFIGYQYCLNLGHIYFPSANFNNTTQHQIDIQSATIGPFINIQSARIGPFISHSVSATNIKIDKDTEGG